MVKGKVREDLDSLKVLADFERLGVTRFSIKYNCSRNTAKRYMLKHGLALPRHGVRDYSDVRAEIIKSYKSGSSLTDLGVKYGVVSGTIQQLLIKWGVYVRGGYGSSPRRLAVCEGFRKLTDKKFETTKKYKRDMAKKYGVSYVTINTWIISDGGRMRKFGRRRKRK